MAGRNEGGAPEPWKPSSLSALSPQAGEKRIKAEILQPLTVVISHQPSIIDMVNDGLRDGLSHSNGSASFISSSSSDDLTKDGIAPALVQQIIGARGTEESDTAVNSPSSATWDFSKPPAEVQRLPHKLQCPIWRRLRYQLLAVYQRLFSIVFIGNMVALITLLVLNRNSRPFGPSLANISTATSANVTGAILIRQEYVINGLYDFFCWTPLWMPLRIRKVVAKLYHFGGIHSGCAVSATIWFILYTTLMTQQYASKEFRDTASVFITYTLLMLLLSICIFAIPKFRSSSHNTFESIHRFGGWLAIALFWVLTLLGTHTESRSPTSLSFGVLVLKTPTFWFLLTITFFIVLPWLRLRKITAFTETLSSHAIRIHFNYKNIGPVVGIRITHSPLKEWHPFATIPSADNASCSIIISDAGDWTRQQITHPAADYWIRGIPITGVLRMAAVFHRIVVVTTGSGIGPCLSMLISRSLPARLLWSTPNPEETYGAAIVQAVRTADPGAMVINTRTAGRPDMVALTYHLFVQSKAEAVFVISNPKLTKKVVYGMESRGIPAYGPIWDS